MQCLDLRVPDSRQAVRAMRHTLTEAFIGPGRHAVTTMTSNYLLPFLQRRNANTQIYMPFIYIYIVHYDIIFIKTEHFISSATKTNSNVFYCLFYHYSQQRFLVLIIIMSIIKVSVLIISSNKMFLVFFLVNQHKLLA